MNHRPLYLEHGALVDRMVERGHLSGSDQRRLQRLRRKLDRLEASGVTFGGFTVLDTEGVEVSVTRLDICLRTRTP